MNCTMFNTLLAAATARVEAPVDGATGVWIKSGTTVIGSGMSMAGAVVTSGQTQFIYNRGQAADCTMSGGRFNVSSGGLLLRPTAYTGVGYIYSGGVGSGLAVRGNFGVVLYTGGYVQSAVLSGTSARITASNGGRAADIYIHSAGFLYVSNGASASGVTVSAGGRLTVYSGGTALAVTSSTGATITVSAGGYIEYA